VTRGGRREILRGVTELLALANPECPGCAALLAVVQRQAQQIEALTARIEELERKLGQNSQNSHQPPSLDKPEVERPKRAGKGRKRGGQKGHKRHTRDLVPPEKVDALHVLLPPHCNGCGHVLMGTDPHPVRHQVTDLPEIKPIVTEYQLHALPCPCCGQHTQAAVPAGVPTGAFGPRLVALVATLTAHYRLSKEKAKELLSDVLGIVISTGALSNLEALASGAVAAPVDEAKGYVQKQGVLYVDETSWQQEGDAAWLWVVVSKLVVIFVIRPSRGKHVAQELLGQTPVATTTTDRYSGYRWLNWLQHQLCWAHLIRDFRKMSLVKETAAAAIGETLLLHARTLFAYWERVKQGTLARSSFQTYASALRKVVRETLARGASLAHEMVSGMCRAMRAVEASMWTFVRVEGVEPTNNEAEREVRHGVIYRKLSYGTQSERGSRFVERMLSVRATLRRQGRNVFPFLVDACEAAFQGIPPPSLLPDSATVT
jgi:transposase